MLKSPSEILRAHPQITWNPRYLGYLLMLGLVRGRKDHRTCYLDESDVLRVWSLVSTAE